MADISGRVFRDYDQDGALDAAIEPGIVGVSVSAYDATGALVGTATSVQCSAPGVPLPACLGANDAGHYQIVLANGGPFRLEFSHPTHLRDSAVGIDSASTVRFVANASSTGQDLGLISPTQTCQPSPTVVASCYEEGASALNNNPGVVSFPFTANGVPVTYGGAASDPTTDALISEVGAVWGAAFQRVERRLFLGAFARRHVGLTASGEGAVFVLDYATAGVPLAATLDLQGQAPANGGAAIDLGTVTRSGGPLYTLPNSAATASIDLDAFDKVGRVAFGDLELDESERTLWLVNLNQDALITVDVSGPSPGLPGTVRQYPLGGAPGWPACVNGVFRPFALEFHDGRGYLGGVCNAEVSQSSSDLEAWVLSFDPAAPAALLTPEINFPLDFTRDPAQNLPPGPRSGAWRPWARSWADTGQSVNPAFVAAFLIYAQPMLTAIEFAADGSMLLGFSDRASHQTGWAQLAADAGATTTNHYGQVVGDLMRVCSVAGAWVLEGAASCPVNAPDDPLFDSADGPFGNGEFFIEDVYIDLFGASAGNHGEVAAGSALVVPGSNQVMTTALDPVNADFLTGSGFADDGTFTFGVHRYSTIDGSRVAGYTIIDANGVSTGKGTSLGEIVALCDPAPIEIGNRLWLDDAANVGIQDPDEAGLGPGVRVDLIDASGARIASAVTDAVGEFMLRLVRSAAPDGDTADAVALLSDPYNQSYVLAIDPATLPAGLVLTMQDVGNDIHDSDASILVAPMASYDGWPGMVFTTGGPGSNDHTLDVGFRAPGTGTIGDVVFCDNNDNGVPDPGEGMAAISVELFGDTNCNDILDGAETSLATTASVFPGLYSFTGLPIGTPVSPACYLVRVDPYDPDLFACNLPMTATETAPDLDTGTPVDLDNDFGFRQTSNPMTLGNRVWLDQSAAGSNNGVHDPGEPGIAGVSVVLLDIFDFPLTATVTDAAGFYRFDVIPGTYSVLIAASNFQAGGALENLTSSLPTEISPNIDVDRNDNGVNEPQPLVNGVKSGTVSLVAGSEPLLEGDPAGAALDQDSNLTVDFGFFQALTLGNRVWWDQDEDAIDDPGEPGIPNVELALLAADGVTPVIGSNGLPRSALTDGAGYYLFEGLAPGAYVVELLADNFLGGGPLEGGSSSSGFDGTDTSDGDDNGIDVAQPEIVGVRSVVIPLAYGSEPLGESGPSGNADDADSNLTVDFGIVGISGIVPPIYAVPTLSFGGMSLLVLLLLGFGVRRLRS